VHLREAAGIRSVLLSNCANRWLQFFIRSASCEEQRTIDHYMSAAKTLMQKFAVSDTTDKARQASCAVSAHMQQLGHTHNHLGGRQMVYKTDDGGTQCGNTASSGEACCTNGSMRLAS
jgi:hypothetical protein